MFLIISVLSIIALLGQWGDGRRPVNKVTITTAIVMLLLITTVRRTFPCQKLRFNLPCLGKHWGLSVTRIFRTFIDSADKPQGPLIYILTIEDPTYVAKALILIATTSVGDAVLVSSLVLCIKHLADCYQIYRLYIVWGRNIWVCLPSIISYVGYVGKQRICS